VSPGLAIVPAAPSDLPAACRALFPDPAQADRLLALFAAGEFDPAGLLTARVGGQLVGSALYQLHPGHAAVAWPPGADQPGVADTLALAVVERFRSAGVKQAQCLLRPTDRPLAGPLERAGFRPITELTFLCRPVGAADATATGSWLRFDPVAEPTPAFATALSATYDGTLDCPELNGTRTIDEILAGYQARADRPDWWLAADGGEPVGVVILSPGPRPGIAELSYLGLVPAVRGRGLGRDLLRFALARAAASAAEWLSLSADVRNEPALRLYRAWGFREYDRQHVLLWSPSG
jgi:ribosomal protein S18 acetylase RimI-like enzyme